MKVSFDYYTTDTAAAATVMSVADDLGLTEIRIIRATDYDDNPRFWNVMGEVDHADLAPLFDIFENYEFKSDWSEL
jgi:hypothetical protein